MTVEEIISPVLDENIQEHINESPIWKSAFKVEEITPEIYRKHQNWYKYHIKFDGLKPIQCTKKDSFTYK